MFDRAPALQASGVGLVRAIERDGDLAGTIDFKRTDWAAGVTELGYMTCPWARSQGVMTEALQAAATWALSDAGLHRVELRIATGNVASRRVAEKAGFEFEGIARSAGYVHAGRVDLAIYSQTTQDLQGRQDQLDVAAPGTGRASLIPASYVILRRGEGPGEVLLQLRRGTGYLDEHWACAAAGHLDIEESAVDAACREAGEELGIAIVPTDLTLLCTMQRSHPEEGDLGQRVDLFFECRTWEGVPERLEPHKSADLRWFALDALPAPVVPHELMVLEQLRGGVSEPLVLIGFDD
jgi:8-oxo-dGTP diphosphatase